MIKVKAFADLTKYISKDGKFETFFDNQGKSVRVKDIVDFYNIPLNDIKIILVNGKDASLETEVNDNDTVTFFSPVGGG
ncbi:molybdenum cofactor biosynthesis protein D [Deferribacter desulfuricans SSM1]|uniref:Molybdenum cofactor biosynthesis protein D n=1 Tax=Deferribacter desulfuricans (strain DSM 14783 / JCM 11476 / NBRC 101012 / SSM1) TaxID=639282 RepID=D3PDB8_DEFDS|nr:MoaD/ThiS family protein [Deferribacter desulfuricans]BAI80591.1 molybdenum cofactor biosynthesis protein D [Deferribacter desulfuricans SSM1]